ncbi:hypothetical protein BGX26_003223 [Mortierella sp. AD094]|nr:hypothetical protein BGX26_003223 [Mortierella sp. AD094]
MYEKNSQGRAADESAINDTDADELNPFESDVEGATDEIHNKEADANEDNTDWAIPARSMLMRLKLIGLTLMKSLVMRSMVMRPLEESGSNDADVNEADASDEEMDVDEINEDDVNEAGVDEANGKTGTKRGGAPSNYALTHDASARCRQVNPRYHREPRQALWW